MTNAIHTCAICLEGFGNLRIKTLPCLHVFHQTCVNRALLNRYVCPLCNVNPNDVGTLNFTLDHSYLNWKRIQSNNSSDVDCMRFRNRERSISEGSIPSISILSISPETIPQECINVGFSLDASGTSSGN